MTVFGKFDNKMVMIVAMMDGWYWVSGSGTIQRLVKDYPDVW